MTDGLPLVVGVGPRRADALAPFGVLLLALAALLGCGGLKFGAQRVRDP